MGKQPDDLHSLACWLFNTPELPETVKECPDYQSWKFWKADPSKPEERKLFEEICEWEGDFGGRKWEVIDGKTLK